MTTNKSVKPLRNYRPPAYPTSEEIGSTDLSRVPIRWRGLKAVVSTIGAAAMSLKALALEATDATKPVASAPVVSVPNAAQPVTSTKTQVVTEVSPIPAKEIAGDGSGAFGCVAMNPPVILPEGEALDLIEREFAKRGIRLTDGHVLDGVPMIKRGWKLSDKRRDELLFGKLKLEDVRPPREPRRMLMDLGTEDGTLLVEFVSLEDQNLWIIDPYEGSTVSDVNTREAALVMANALKERTEGKPVRVAVFYDPCAKPPKDFKPIIPADAKKSDVWRIEYQQKDDLAGKIAREKLKAQIEAFFENLARNTNN